MGRDVDVLCVEALLSLNPAPLRSGWALWRLYVVRNELGSGIQQTGEELRRGYLGTRRAVSDWIRDLIFNHKHQKLVHTWDHICNAFPYLKRKQGHRIQGSKRWQDRPGRLPSEIRCLSKALVHTPTCIACSLMLKRQSRPHVRSGTMTGAHLCPPPRFRRAE